MADLSEEEDKELKRTDEGNADGVGIRRDFSVIHSKQLKKNHLFLGPARFVNVSSSFELHSAFSRMILLALLSTIAIIMSSFSVRGGILPSESSR